MFDDIFAYFYLFNKDFCYFRGFRAAISIYIFVLLFPDLHVKLKPFDKY